MVFLSEPSAAPEEDEEANMTEQLFQEGHFLEHIQSEKCYVSTC